MGIIGERRMDGVILCCEWVGVRVIVRCMVVLGKKNVRIRMYLQHVDTCVTDMFMEGGGGDGTAHVRTVIHKMRRRFIGASPPFTTLGRASGWLGGCSANADATTAFSRYCGGTPVGKSDVGRTDRMNLGSLCSV